MIVVKGCGHIMIVEGVGAVSCSFEGDAGQYGKIVAHGYSDLCLAKIDSAIFSMWDRYPARYDPACVSSVA